MDYAKVKVNLVELTSYASAVEDDLTFDEVRYKSEDYEGYAYYMTLDTTYYYPNPQGEEYSHGDYTFIAMSEDDFQKFVTAQLSDGDRNIFAKEDWIVSETEEPGRRVKREIIIERKG